MAKVIKFPRRMDLPVRSEPGFAVQIMPQDGLWLVVCRNHGWLHLTRSEAQAVAREIADGFGVPTVLHLRGAA